MSYASSAGSHRLTSGQDVLGGVDVRSCRVPQDGHCQVLVLRLSSASRYPHAAAHGERRSGVVRRLPGAAGFEPRVPGAAGEERAERLVLMPQRLLQRHAGDLGQERQVRVLLHGGQRPVGRRIRGALALQMPAGTAGGQGAVPHDSDAAERAAQHLLLRRAGVGPAPVRDSHPYRIARVIEKSRKPRRTGGCLVLPRRMGHWIPPRRERRGISREVW